MDRFKLMETYVAVVKARSYTRAARELGVTRAMISKRIQDLEAALGAKLLNRNTHRLSVTATGADYFDSCAAMLADLHALEERIQAKRATPRGEIHVLSTRTFGETMLAPVVVDFCQRYPTITVHMTMMDRDLSPDGMDLVAGGYDLAIRTLPEGDSTLIARPLPGLPRMLVAAPDYLARHGVPQQPTDLARHVCLDPSGAAHCTWDFIIDDGRVAVAVSGAPRANSSAVVRRAVLKGLGIGMLREYLVADDLAAGTLVRVLEDHPVDERKLHVVYQKDRYQPLRMRLFIDFLLSRLAQPDRAESSPPPRRAARSRAT